MNIFKYFAVSTSVLYLTACGGGSSTDSTITNNAPVATIVVPAQEIFNEEEILLDASQSVDIDNDPITYSWKIIEQPAQGRAQFSANNVVNPIFIADLPGFYTVQLIVNDGKIDSVPTSLKFEVLHKDSKLNCAVIESGQLDIKTENNTTILKDSYVNGSLLLSGINQSNIALDTELKGRGNSTWGAEKKPYRLKLKKKSISSLYGMPEDRNWVLLANAFDGTMLRNSAALCLGQNFIRKSWTPQYQFVDLKLNDVDKGLYLMTEHVAVGPNKVNLINNNTEDDVAAAEFFIEMTPNSRVNSKDIYVKSKYGTYFEVKSDVSKKLDIRQKQLDSIKAYIDKFEEAIYTDNFDPDNGYAKYIDVDSAIDYILLNELFKDNDRFWASTHFYKPNDGKLTFGPIWDYDLAAGGYICNDVQNPEGWWISTRNYPIHLFKDPAFRKQALVRWNVLQAKVPNLLKYIDKEAKNIESSQVNNFKLWSLNIYTNNCGVGNNVFLGNTSIEQVGYLKTWLTTRTKWMDEQFKNGNF